MHDWPKLAICVQTCFKSSKTLQTPLGAHNRSPRPVIELRGGLRGTSQPERPDVRTKHRFWDGTRGVGKAPRPLWNCDELMTSFIDAILQFASVTMTLYWNCNAKRFCSPKYDFWWDLGREVQKIFHARYRLPYLLPPHKLWCNLTTAPDLLVSWRGVSSIPHPFWCFPCLGHLRHLKPGLPHF